MHVFFPQCKSTELAWHSLRVIFLFFIFCGEKGLGLQTGVHVATYKLYMILELLIQEHDASVSNKMEKSDLGISSLC